MTTAIEVFRENYDRHFLPQGKELLYRKPKYPGVSAGHEADDQDDEVPEDGADAPERDDDEQQRTIEVRCSSCGEVNSVSPPQGHRFLDHNDSDDGERVQYACPKCGHVNRVRHHRVVKIEEAAHAFNESYRRTSRPIEAHDPAEAFEESYAGGVNAPPPSGVVAISTFLTSYGRKP